MGKATRWLRSLLGGKKDGSRSSGNGENSSTAVGGGEKKRWSFGKSGRDSTDSGPTTGDSQWSRPYYFESEKEQSKHAIAVAAATAAAADAAVAAARAAAAVVKLTSNGRGVASRREVWAALKIQTVFRAYLAKKALRALRSLVKLQALVRGFLVRKQAAAALQSMQALIRAQAVVRTRRSRVLPVKDYSRFYPEVRSRRSLERYDETRSEQLGSCHSRRLSSSMESTTLPEDSPKIVEIDPGRPKPRNRRLLNSCSCDSAEEPLSSALFCHVPSRASAPYYCRNVQDLDWSLAGDECRFSTAQSTPRFFSSSGPIAGATPVTPAKSECGADGILRRYHQNSSLLNHPNYMANTQSFTAKVRSLSAPKQRPEPAVAGGTATTRRQSLHEMAEKRSSLSGVRMQRSCSVAQEYVVSGKILNGACDLEREIEVGQYLQRRW